MLTDELRFKILKVLQDNPDLNQRQLADHLNISLGKTNYCIQALIGKGLLKVKNFKNNRNKLAYSYLLTPGGMEEKAKLTIRFLKRKMEEYEILKTEIEELTRDSVQYGQMSQKK
ncbi:MAG: MarR family EPS-associated transcriptional regulator [Spirochaetia bacterium]|nr:MarR family EPS-associated transcriptional regulator [Spirochaetia bacterium]